MEKTQQHFVLDGAKESLEFGPEEIQIPVPWGHVSGKWWGSKDHQPIVALHGWQDNAGSFDRLAPLIAKDIPLLCIDLPGHGFSSRLPPGIFYYVYWDGVILLRRIAQYYNWNKIKLLGHSAGGGISFLYAASYPDEVEFLISLDMVCASGPSILKLTSVTSDQIDKFLKFDNSTLSNEHSSKYDEMIRVAVEAHGGSVTQTGGKVLMKRGMKPSTIPGMYVYTRDPRMKAFVTCLVTPEVNRAYAKHVKCMFLNIRATKGPKYDPPEQYDEILDIIKTNSKRFEYHEVDGTHHVHLNEPEKVAPIIRAFLSLAKNT